MTTSINYTLPQKFASAQIVITDKNGKTLKQLNISGIGKGDTSISKSKQLEQAIPASTIASLSSGEFVGMVADNPEIIRNFKEFEFKDYVHTHSA